MKGKISKNSSRSKGVGSRSSYVPPRSSRLSSTAFLSRINHHNATSKDSNEGMKNRTPSVSCSPSRTPPIRRNSTRENAFQVFQRINALPVRLFPASLQEWKAKESLRLGNATKRKNVDRYSIDEEDCNGGLKAGEVLVVSGGGRSLIDEQHPAFRGSRHTLENRTGVFQNVRQISSHDMQWVHKVAGYHVHKGGELFIIDTPATRPFSLNKLQKMHEEGYFSSSAALAGVVPEKINDPLRTASVGPFSCSHDENHDAENFHRQKKNLLSLLYSHSSVSMPSRRSFSPSACSTGSTQSRIHMRRLENWSQWASFCGEAFSEKGEELTEENRKKSCRTSALDRCTGKSNGGEAGETNDNDSGEKCSPSSSSVYPFSVSSKKRNKNFSDNSVVEASFHPQSELHTDKELPVVSSAVTTTTTRMRVSLLIVSLHMGYLLEYERFTGKEISFVSPLLLLVSRLRNCALIILEQQAERIGIKGDEIGGIACAPNRMMMRMSRAINTALTPSDDTSPSRKNACDKPAMGSDASNEKKTREESKNLWVSERVEINHDKRGSGNVPVLCSSSSGPQEFSSFSSLFSFPTAPIVFRIPSPSSFSFNFPLTILSRFCALLSTSSPDDLRVAKGRSQSERAPHNSHSFAPTIMNPLKDSLYTSSATSSSGSSKHLSSSFFTNKALRDSRDSNSARASSSGSVTALWFLHLESYFAPPPLSTEGGGVGIPFPLDDRIDRQKDDNEVFSSFRMGQPNGIKRTIVLPGEPQESSSRKKERESRSNEDCSLISSFVVKDITPLAVPITMGKLFKIASKLDKQEADERYDPLYRSPQHSFPKCCGNATQDVADGLLDGPIKKMKNEKEEDGKEEKSGINEFRRKSDTQSGFHTFPFHPNRTDELYAVLVGVEPNILQ